MDDERIWRRRREPTVIPFQILIHSSPDSSFPFLPLPLCVHQRFLLDHSSRNRMPDEHFERGRNKELSTRSSLGSSLRRMCARARQEVSGSCIRAIDFSLTRLGWTRHHNDSGRLDMDRESRYNVHESSFDSRWLDVESAVVDGMVSSRRARVHRWYDEFRTDNELFRGQDY